MGTIAVPQDSFFIQTILPGKINYGKFLLSSPLSQSANTGFNFAPSRDMSEAVFWNPSATSFSRKSANISLLTNVKNNVKLAGFYHINKKFTLGAGAIYTMQDEFRKTIYFQAPISQRPEDSVSFKLKEYAAFISPAYKINNKLSVGLTLKSIWQDFNIPDVVFVENSSKGTFYDSTIKDQYFDVDVSATYKISNAVQVGINLMNLAGTELYADAFISGQAAIPIQKQRSLGLGINYKCQRFNIGADLLFTEDDFYDAALGVNYVPFNNALISAGIAVKQLSYSVAFRIKHFRLAYIDDNNFLVNEKRKGKSSILQGRIHGGFIFDF